MIKKKKKSLQYILLWQNYWFKSHTIAQYYLKVNPRKMSLHPNRAKLICHESVMMCLFPRSGVYIFQEDITVYLQVKSALKREFQEIFTFQMVGLISEALRPISALSSRLSIYFHHSKIILLTPRSKTRHTLENYNHNSYRNLLRSQWLQTECKGSHGNCLPCILVSLAHFKNMVINCSQFIISRNIRH